jgi:hypothetical protein
MLKKNVEAVLGTDVEYVLGQERILNEFLKEVPRDEFSLEFTGEEIIITGGNIVHLAAVASEALCNLNGFDVSLLTTDELIIGFEDLEITQEGDYVHLDPQDEWWEVLGLEPETAAA